MSGFSVHKTVADRSATDRRRHKQKIEKAIREGIHDIVADESIIGQDGKKKFKIPVRGIKEYRFVYGSNENSKQVGSAPGKDLQRGQVIKDKRKQRGQGSEDGKASNQKGDEFYEVEISLDELAQYLFAELELPDLERKSLTQTRSEKLKRSGYRPEGIIPRLDKKKTAINRIKRLKATQRSEESPEDDELDGSFHNDDLTYRHYKQKLKENTNAVIIMMMDVSGSMSKSKKFLARSFFFLLYQFIRTKYDNTEIVFIAHDTEAKECSEDQFFNRGSSGGTMVSSAYNEALSVIEKRFHPSAWNVYAFHCSDGDNFSFDTNDMITAAEKLTGICQLFGYCEIVPKEERGWKSEDSVIRHLAQLVGRKMRAVEIHDKEDVWTAFKIMFGNYGSEQ